MPPVRACLVAAVALAVALAPGAGADPAPPAVVVFGGDRDYPPYEFLDEDGRPAGYNVDQLLATGRAVLELLLDVPRDLRRGRDRDWTLHRREGTVPFNVWPVRTW